MNFIYDGTPDYSNKCENCCFRKYIGTYQVGSYESGGPERFYNCSKGKDISMYRTHAESARNCDENSDNYY